MHFDGIMNTMEGRHLVFSYAAVALIQGGYFVWIVMNWLKLDRAEDAEQKKQRS
jgi:drug/metabolite transporter superfamily protein YnfA